MGSPPLLVQEGTTSQKNNLISLPVRMYGLDNFLTFENRHSTAVYRRQLEAEMNRFVSVTVLLLLALLPANVFGQSANATVSGTVADATGALIPGVTVTATNTQTGVVTTVFSNETGTYNFASLQPGTYRVSAALQGFRTQSYTVSSWEPRNRFA
jgi:hypothetical protein